MVDAAQKTAAILAMHVLGVGLDEYIAQINSFENEDQYDVRKKYARSNRDLFERLCRPIDKVFSARGGSVYYNLPKSADESLKQILRNVENGLSLRRWIQQYWEKAYEIDPMGLVFIEIDERSEAYPTYKSSASIYDYKLNGRRLDYVIFDTGEKTEAGDRIFRIVDDARDIRVSYDGNVIRELDSFTNWFGFVPAIINSDIPVFGTETYQSPLANVIEIADEYLRETSVKSVYKMMHGFPKSWKYGMACDKCNGTGYCEGEVCPSCKGTKVRLKTDVADSIVLPVPEGSDPKIAPDVAGFISPDIAAWERMSDELKGLEDMMFETLWGTHQLEHAENNTATGKFIDTQPVNEKLSDFSTAAEKIETFITDCIGQYFFATAYKGCSINYGRRFTIESPDTIWEKYDVSRKNMSPVSALDALLREYLYAKYENNSLELIKELKKIDLEPFIHYSPANVQSLQIAEIDYLKKVYFSEWEKTVSENEWIYGSAKSLNAKFDAWIQEKQVIVKQQQEEQFKFKNKGNEKF
jgi:hypothetical protein